MQYNANAIQVHLTNHSDMGEIPQTPPETRTLQEIITYLNKKPSHAIILPNEDGTKHAAFFQGADESWSTWYYQELPLEEPDADMFEGTTRMALLNFLAEWPFDD